MNLAEVMRQWAEHDFARAKRWIRDSNEATWQFSREMALMNFASALKWRDRAKEVAR